MYPISSCCFPTLRLFRDSNVAGPILKLAFNTIPFVNTIYSLLLFYCVFKGFLFHSLKPEYYRTMNVL